MCIVWKYQLTMFTDMYCSLCEHSKTQHINRVLQVYFKSWLLYLVPSSAVFKTSHVGNKLQKVKCKRQGAPAAQWVYMRTMRIQNDITPAGLSVTTDVDVSPSSDSCWGCSRKISFWNSWDCVSCSKSAIPLMNHLKHVWNTSTMSTAPSV